MAAEPDWLPPPAFAGPTATYQSVPVIAAPPMAPAPPAALPGPPPPLQAPPQVAPAAAVASSSGAAAAAPGAAAKLPKAVFRQAAGERWKDESLMEWPENDHRIFVGDIGPEVTDEMLSSAFRKYPSFAKAKVCIYLCSAVLVTL